MEPSEELFAVFGPEKEQKLATRSLTPHQAALEIANLLEARRVSEGKLAKELAISSSVIKDLAIIQKIPSETLERYLSPYWRPTLGQAKMHDQLPFSALAALAKAIKDQDSPADISKAVALVARHNIGKNDLRDLNFLRRRNPSATLRQCVELLEGDRGIFAVQPREITTHIFFADCGSVRLSQSQMKSIQEDVERVIGPIVEQVAQNGSIVSVTLLSGKVVKTRLDALLSSDDVQEIVTKHATREC